MKATNRFQLDRNRTGEAILKGTSHFRVDAYALSGKVEVGFEISGSLEGEDALRTIHALLTQLKENAERREREEDRPEFDCGCDD